jgi:putative glutamine amidotransferase
MRPPLIGITTRRLHARSLGEGVPEGIKDAALEGIFTEYAESIAGAGGIPVLISRAAEIPHLVDRIDGLVLSGGEDVEPGRYGEIADDNATGHDPERDTFEMALLKAALAAGTPILAICRGVQMANVVLGGTLVAHLESDGGFSHHETDEHRAVRRHGIEVEPNSMLAEALAHELDADHTCRVNSYHHQAVRTPGEGLRVVARADDGTVEAVECRARRLLGIQWHPEMHDGVDPIFSWFIQQVRTREEGAA